MQSNIGTTKVYKTKPSKNQSVLLHGKDRRFIREDKRSIVWSDEHRKKMKFN